MRLIRERIARTACTLLLSLVVWPACAKDVDTPRQVVESMEQAVLDVLADARAGLVADPERLYALARRELRPHFDLERAGRVILGPALKSASAAELDAFHKAFEDYLVTSYAMALRHVTTETFTVTGEPRPLGTEEILLPVRLMLVDGETIDAELRMRRGAPGWLVWDAGAGGTSLVRLYRGDIGTEAAVHGVAHATASLQEVAARNRSRDLESSKKEAGKLRSR